jgi:SAM-dependent methyltransferase
MALIAPKSDIRGSVAGSIRRRSYRFHDFGFKRSVFFDFQTRMRSRVPHQPVDIATRETLKFVASRLPRGATILEVGCGDGQVASQLLKCGYRVTGLDSNSDMIAKARTRGVPTVIGLWPKFDSNVAFDAIAFTRSLHHINPLSEAIVRARDLLTPEGLLLVEDFAPDEVNEATVHWFVKVLRSKKAKALINLVAGQIATELLSAADVMQTWRQNRGHDLHSFTTMSEAIAERFLVRENQSVPYFYRYLIPILPNTRAAASFVDGVFHQEKFLSQGGEIVALGRRIIASNDR